MSLVEEKPIQTSTLSDPIPEPVSVWRNADYLRLWAGQVVSSIGSQVSGLALPLLILALTHSPAKAGLLAALRGLPYLLLCLPAGALVDRWDPRRVMLLCDTGRALALGSIPLALAFGHLSMVQLGVVTVIEGTLFVFFDQADSNCLVRVVSKAQLGAAVAQNQAIWGVSGLLGPSLGGLLYGLGRGVPFLTDAISYALSVVAILTLNTDVRPAVRETEVTPNLGAEIVEGLHWLNAHKIIRFIAVLTGGLMLACAGWALILIVLAQKFGATPFTIGLLMATGGVGSIVGSLLAVPLQKRFRFGPLMIGATWVWAITWGLYAFAPNLITLGIVNALSFVIVPIYLGTQYAYRLAQIPDHLQGRVNSVFRLIAFGSGPVGLAVTGLMLQKLGPVPTVLITFVPQLLLSLAATFYRPLRAE
ncbi:MAG: MFS transporter [Janthinobacterium lividum]